MRASVACRDSKQKQQKLLNVTHLTSLIEVEIEGRIGGSGLDCYA